MIYIMLFICIVIFIVLIAINKTSMLIRCTKTHSQVPMDVKQVPIDVKTTLKEFFNQDVFAALNLVLDKLREYNVVLGDDKLIKDSALTILARLRDCSKLLKDFFSLYPSWRDERIQCIRNISYLADEMERHHRNVNIVQLPTVGLGILGGVLTITGIALAPVTFGASLGLSIAGGVVGVGAAATGAGATITDLALAKKKKKEASECFENHKRKTAELTELIQKIATCSDEIDKSFSDKVIAFVVDFIREVATFARNSKAAFAGFCSVASCTFAVMSLVKTIPQAVIGLKTLVLLITNSPVLHSVFDLVFSPARIAGAGVRVTAQTARVTAKVGAPALAAFGYIGGVVGIGVSGAVGAYTIYDMVKNKNKTDASKKLREFSSQLQDEFCDVEKVYNMLGEEESEC